MIPRRGRSGLPERDGPSPRVALLFLLLAILARISLDPSPACAAGRLKLVTINVWTGLDYIGTRRMGEYESPERRQARYRALVHHLRELRPDVVFVQEANPLPGYARRLAGDLGFSEIHQVCNGGIRIGALGIPVNLREGIAILAHPSLSMEKVGAWKLFGPPGLFRDGAVFQLGEARFALVGRIAAGGKPVSLVNVHLGSAPPEDPSLAARFDAYASAIGMKDGDRRAALEAWSRGAADRRREVDRILERLGRLPAGDPVIVAGDFNARPKDPEIVFFRERGGFLDAFAAGAAGDPEGTASRAPTWDPDRNANVRHSTGSTDARGRRLDPYGLLKSAWDGEPRRIDYVFLGKGFGAGDIVSARIVLDTPVDGTYPSDHFGVWAEIRLP